MAKKQLRAGWRKDCAALAQRRLCARTAHKVARNGCSRAQGGRTVPHLLRRFSKQGRNVSDKTGTSYAPALFAKEAEAKAAKVRKDALAAAMGRLFTANKLHMEPYGYPSRATFRIAVGQKP